MDKFKLTGTQTYRGREIPIEGILELTAPGYFTGEIYGHKELINPTTGKNKSLTLNGIINNEYGQVFDHFNDAQIFTDMTVIKLAVHEPNNGNNWFPPSWYVLMKSISPDDKGLVVEERTIRSIPSTEFISGEYLGTWHQDIRVYDGPGSRARGRPNSGSGGNGAAKIVLTKLE
ncbi:MAG: hypothetical protein ACP5N1_02715 [Candidatus Woesearchaeota archaeon]